MARIISIKNSAYTWNQVVRLFNEECSNMYFGKEKLLPSEQEDERIISSFLLSFLKDESLLAQQKMTMGFSIEPICSDTAIYLIRLVPYMKEGHPDLIEGYNDCFGNQGFHQGSTNRRLSSSSNCSKGRTFPKSSTIWQSGCRSK